MTAPTTGEREPDEISAALNDLEHAVKCEYAFPNVHQAMQRKFDRDMSVVTDARNAYDALRADIARVTAETEKLRRGWLSDIARINEALSWTANEYAEIIATQYDGDDVECYVDHIGWLTREYDRKDDALATAQREAAGLRGLVEAATAWAELRRDPENQEHTIVVWAEADRRLLENVNELTPAPEAGR